MPQRWTPDYRSGYDAARRAHARAVAAYLAGDPDRTPEDVEVATWADMREHCAAQKRLLTRWISNIPDGELMRGEAWLDGWQDYAEAEGE